MIFEKIIIAFGGLRPTARALDVPVSTVASWKKNGIPKWRRDLLVAKLIAQGDSVLAAQVAALS